MSLIEKLGGYEKAKNVFSQMKHSCERGYIEGKGVFYSYIGLQSALLEYRRQHNIFEVGDKVVDTTGFFDWLCKVEYLSTDGRVVMYKYDQRKGDTAFTTWPFIETVRHATPEEIAAGRRL